ncbi:hypothetical protein [Oscillatoria nigro-viridis]|uniref:hypothetical protein n=1 Tax=Phormidium nigroviride TaxID=482564 RepID=UPI0005A20512|nr:hypothetical protein [Oscillatoria nigro-viridis]
MRFEESDLTDVAEGWLIDLRFFISAPMNPGASTAPGYPKLAANPPCPDETKIKPNTLQLLEYLLFSVGFYFTAKAYIVGLQSKFVVAVLVGFSPLKKTTNLFIPLLITFLQRG